MTILSQPELWEDGFSANPPFQWESVEADNRWWFDNTMGSIDSLGGVSYIGEDPIPDTLTFLWEIVVPPAQGNVFFYYDIGAGEVEIDLGTQVGTGEITLENDGWTEFYWGVSTQENITSPYLYTAMIAVGEEEEEEEEVTPEQYYRVEYLPVEDFVTMCNSRVVTSDDVVITMYGPDDVELTIVTNKPPTYWTSVNDDYILFDSYDSEVESSIIADKTQVFVDKSPTFALEDDHVINLPASLMPYLERRAEAYCLATINQQPNLKSEQIERQLRVRSQRNKWRHRRLVKDGPDFGR